MVMQRKEFGKHKAIRATYPARAAVQQRATDRKGNGAEANNSQGKLGRQKRKSECRELVQIATDESPGER